jgi:hypothetical protein
MKIDKHTQMEWEEFTARVDAFRATLAAHAGTVGVPAPLEDYEIEAAARYDTIEKGDGWDPPPDPPPEPIDPRKAAIAAVQSRLDAQAQEWGYDNIFTAVTYAEEPAIPQFQAEGRVLRAWRSATWATCYASTATTLEALLAELPPAPERPTA